MSKTLNMPKNVETKELIEGHPIGVNKIIKGDLRTRTWVADGITHTAQNTEGILLYEREEQRDRPWFILVLDTRVKNVEQ